ncbi:hypothetical protein F5B18DRAFT_642442 [Nemania serpens]|nr:hypothetical protein F5B18DRAFT_642442 [Nemania serpens]
MSLLLEVICPKTKSKSKSNTKTSKKEKCIDCIARKIVQEEMYLPPRPIPMMNQNQPGYNYGYGYGYGYVDRSSWEDNYPAVISNKQWSEHMKTAQNAYNSAQDNATKMGEVKSAITGEVKEAQKAIKETHASVNNTHDAIGLAHASIQGTHLAVKDAYLAIQKTQDVINNRHAEQMSKQEECAADVAKLRQMVEADTKKREETRRLQEMVQYAQSQGLLQTQAQAQAQALAQFRLDLDRDRRDRSSRSSSPTTSASSSGPCEGRCIRVDEREADKRRRRERKMEQQHLLQLQEEQERLLRAADEIEIIRRRDAVFHHPRFNNVYYDDLTEAPPYNNTYSYADYGIGGGGGAGHRGARGPRRVQPRWGSGRV